MVRVVVSQFGDVVVVLVGIEIVESGHFRRLAHTAGKTQRNAVSSPFPCGQRPLQVGARVEVDVALHRIPAVEPGKAVCAQTGLQLESVGCKFCLAVVLDERRHLRQGRDVAELAWTRTPSRHRQRTA